MNFSFRLPMSSTMPDAQATIVQGLVTSRAEIELILSDVFQDMTLSTTLSTTSMFFFGHERPFESPKLQCLMWIRERAQVDFPEAFAKLTNLSRYPSLTPRKGKGTKWDIMAATVGTPKKLRLWAKYVFEGVKLRHPLARSQRVPLQSLQTHCESPPRFAYVL
jgi:hypothetical protein